MQQCVDNPAAVAVVLERDDLERIDKVAPPLSTSLRYYEAAISLDLRPDLYC